ncbi:glycerophosphodiester phosphodiesterase [Cellulosilyticum sp. I15G10I2]|uniref:glycerophosphodiester phosphodiesterase n=1 Tax=Cellulosilyticum sp. I15G10I2 TaxID=1892843 RepID=UPI00085CA561|nr:glycerophosphodiester phosphodiesterase [Cellulosilyticum sp. I15G10I2]
MVLNFAHRGASGYYAENTMLAFGKAVEMGCDGIETDVHLSKDGIPVLIHDETVDRTTGKKGYVEDYTFSELAEMGIPSLEQLIVLAKRCNVCLNIEIKNGRTWYEGVEEKVIEILKKHKMIDKTIVSSFNHYAMVKCKMLCKELQTGLLYVEALYKPEMYCAYVGADAIHPNYIVLNKQVVEDVHRAGCKVNPYTVNNEGEMLALIEMGVDMIITNYPDRLSRILKR